MVLALLSMLAYLPTTNRARRGEFPARAFSSGAEAVSVSITSPVETTDSDSRTSRHLGHMIITTRPLLPTLFGRPLIAGLVAAALLAVTVPTDKAQANIDAKRVAPSRSQLARLNEFESLIRYFASLSYGDRGARVSSNYMRALVLSESSAHQHATSNKGARGLTQIMPQTGQEAVHALLEMHTDFLYVDRERLENFSATDLYDPAVNILIAAYLTANYHANYNGSSALVTAAWNAGPQAVLRHGNKTPPYKETHQLIERVNGYQRFFDSGRFASTLGDGWNTRGWNAPGWDRSFDSAF